MAILTEQYHFEQMFTFWYQTTKKKKIVIAIDFGEVYLLLLILFFIFCIVYVQLANKNGQQQKY